MSDNEKRLNDVRAEIKELHAKIESLRSQFSGPGWNRDTEYSVNERIYQYNERIYRLEDEERELERDHTAETIKNLFIYLNKSAKVLKRAETLIAEHPVKAESDVDGRGEMTDNQVKHLAELFANIDLDKLRHLAENPNPREM